jgi:hypothetical protein
MQITLGIVVLLVGVALTWMGRISSAGVGPVAILVRNDVAAMFYIMLCMVLCVAGVAAIITAS